MLDLDALEPLKDVVWHQVALDSVVQLSAFSASRRTASDRPTSCCSAQASIFAVSAGGIRTATNGVRPLGGGRYGLRVVNFPAMTSCCNRLYHG
jgi:hypothetical protein